RRRHTRFSRDWSSDVCSSDLIRSRPRGPKTVLAYDWVATAPTPARAHDTTAPTARNLDATATPRSPVSASNPTIEKVDGRTVMRSEERRVGNERGPIGGRAPA